MPVEVNSDWVIDPAKYSFCLYDMEVMWKDRNIYIETMDSGRPSLIRYRACR